MLFYLYFFALILDQFKYYLSLVKFDFNIFLAKNVFKLQPIQYLLGVCTMVKFQEYWVKKRCKPGRGPYRYRGVLLRIPKKYHGRVDSFLGVDLNVKDIIISGSKEERMINIIISTGKGI
jgi:hypothetical protein